MSAKAGLVRFNPLSAEAKAAADTDILNLLPKLGVEEPLKQVEDYSGIVAMERGKGISGNIPADLREVAAVWEKSAEYFDTCGEPELASRDRRFAAAMREAASILEALRMDS